MGSNYKKWGLFVLFFTLIAFKATALHVYTHDLFGEDHIECTLCEITLDNHQFGADVPPSLQLPTPKVNILKASLQETLISTFTPSFNKATLFGRPPPRL